MTATIVLLNGTGSAGKSSTAKALQRIAARPTLHVSMDSFLEMLPPGTFGDPEFCAFETTHTDAGSVTAIHSGPMMERLMSGLRQAVAAMAADGLDLVVDDVFWGDELAEYRRLLAAFDFHPVRLYAPLKVLEQRERDRGDRVLGLARWQHERIAGGPSYDLEIDTSRVTPDDAAALIKLAFGL